MITEIIKKWEENKLKLEEYFKTTKQEEYQSYEAIVRKIFEICINGSDSKYDNFNLEKLHVIDDGDYQGTQLFIIPKETDQPSAEDYAKRLKAMIDALGIKKMILVGHSVGAMQAAAFTALYPESVEALVIANVAEGYKGFDAYKQK